MRRDSELDCGFAMVFIAQQSSLSYMLEEAGNTKNYRKQPRFYGELMGGLLVSYSSSSEAFRYIIASDILGYVNAALIYTHKIKNKFDEITTYENLIPSLFDKLDAALTYFKGGDATTGNRLLNEVMDILKIIIMTEYMVAENWEHTSNPLGTASVNEDRVSPFYKDI